MRLAGQAKCGYYPAAREAVQSILDRLSWTGDPAVLDPCAGRGEALRMIADDSKGRSYAVELDETRGKAAALQGFNCTVQPCSIFDVRFQGQGFDFIWCNPPYDDELGGGSRVEHEFLRKVHAWLRPGGVLCFVVPERTLEGNSPSNLFLRERYDELALVEFPDDVREFNEVVAIGIRRKTINTKDTEKMDRWNTPPLPLADDFQQWRVSGGGRVSLFEKGGLTPDEFMAALGGSPLQRLLADPLPEELPRPPLPLAKGHRAILLAAGHLDGIVRPPGEPPHVVRGTASKVRYLKSQETTENPDGSSTTKTVWGERVALTLRAVDQDGEIKTLVTE